MDTSLDMRQHATANSEGELSPLEQEILDEYAKLVGNLDGVSTSHTKTTNYCECQSRTATSSPTKK